MRDLRISVMDRCNFRCPYCMPENTYHEGFHFLEPQARLSFDEIVRVAEASAQLGVSKLRLTGGEPLLRSNLENLITRLVAIPGIEDVALTTNGVLLGRQAQALRRAGLHRVTVSLDSIDPAVFARMSGGRAQLDTVLDGIEAAREAGFPDGVKLNAVIQNGVNDTGAGDLAGRFRHTGVVVRFIEYMDVGNRNGWERVDVVSSRSLLGAIDARWKLEPLSPAYRGEVAKRWRYVDGGGEIGFISSVSAPFCGDCSRARLSSDGKLHTCLFSADGADLRTILRAGADEQALVAALSAIWRARADRYSEERAERRAQAANDKIEMHYIGG